MLATPAAVLPIGPDWTYEVKWDGYRTVAVKNGPAVRLLSRNLKNLTGDYPAIAAGVAALKPHDLVLDGEIVALDESGRPSFQALQHRRTTGLALVYYVFDLLQIGRESLLDKPLNERRRRLAALLSSATAPVLASHALPGSPTQIEREIRKLRLEGVVAKRRSAPYRPGQRSDAWVKVKFSPRQEFAIGGYRPGATTFDSVLVGFYQGRRLYFAGKVRAGFTPHTRAEVFHRIADRPASVCPFVNLPNRAEKKSRWGEGITEADMTSLRWVKVTQVIEVAFVEWTADGLLRHPAFVAIRDDKRAAEVRRESVP
jgi:bifunctional non-homologous end joining protein LigD